uniref:Glycosyl transferase family gt77 hemi-cellulose cell wall biosynthesis n=1 Tax=Tetraselmis sp. GSL018 TaxID=582737 RepID=A0A061RCR6_9CHLO
MFYIKLLAVLSLLLPLGKSITELGRGCICSPRTPAVETAQGHFVQEANSSRIEEDFNLFLAKQSIPSAHGQPTVVVVVANKGHAELVNNLICSLNSTGITKYVLFASDSESYKFYRSTGYVGVWYEPTLFAEDTPADAIDFSKGKEHLRRWTTFNRQRAKVARYVVERGYDILFTDADVVFHRNVVPELQYKSRFVSALFLWDGPTSGRESPAKANAGFYYLRAGPSALSFLDKVLSRLDGVEAGTAEGDQTSFNRALVDRPPVASYALLDNSTYLCGHTLKRHLDWPGFHLKASKGPAKVSETEPVAVVHVNWTGSLAEKKRLLLRSGFWHLCKGLGPKKYEEHLRATGEWFDAESLARRPLKRKRAKARGR